MRQILITIILIFVFNTTVKAQDTIPKDPKIGLVLSGGGAKGFAHIGALKVIDSLGIRVDYVAGTSMGAIIGSLYASGYSGKQLDSIFEGVNFDDILNDNIPRYAKSTYEREISEKYAITLPFDNLKVKLPSALSKGQNTFNLLTQLLLHVCNEDDFSKLPIPFFCIGTDVETGQQVILDKGNLPQAVKASGAFPSLFQPVEIDGKLLIDGGVVNNYPIKELREKGVDIIIGVDVQDGLANRTDLSSAPQILFQINNFRTINDMKIKSKETDIYIKPDITKFNVVSFDDGRQIIDNGHIAAIEKIEVLKQLKLNQLKKPPIRRTMTSPDSLQINYIETNGIDKYTRSYILGKLDLRPYSKVAYQDLSKGANNVVATNNFDNFFYELKLEDNKGYRIITDVSETKKTTFLKLGLHYDGLYKSAMLANVTKKQFLLKNDVASLDLIVGDHVRYNFDYFIDKGIYWSIGLSSRYSEFDQAFVANAFLTPAQMASSGINKISTDVSDLTNQFYLQTLFRNDLVFTVGAEHKKLKIKTETILSSQNQNETVFENSNYLSLFGALKFDTYDSKYFPTEGIYFSAEGNYYLYSSDFSSTFSPFTILKADLGYAFKINDKLSLNLTSDGGFKINPKANRFLDFVLGGYGNNFINNFKPFYGYDFLSIAADSYIKGGINLDYQFFPKNHIMLSANYANVEDRLYDTGNWFSLPDYSGYAIGYSFQSFLGPIEAKYTFSPETKQSYWFFNLGYWF
ncbi:patatin-like phospholipase family protein [Olleya sp. YS]|uniref:patatin-like phospholipase family protein n=1 Tax=Olleya sp. YS TaxID=3028318 RepID=UPI00243442B4|nr:patatin-like phospholipase family protein [Olleya sp. YS]WGD36011.1 patatin-like phospholipase family protein [Olleya sp. YS]